MLNLKGKLRSGEMTLGSWITLAHPAIAEIMARAGFDWLVVDMEHSVITIREAEELIRIIELSGIVPLVRLTSNDADQIKRVMDAGAHGVVVPMVNCPEDAEKAVSAVHYAPNGTRGVGLARAQGYGDKFSSYFEWQKENAVVIVQIEHKKALENLEDIITVKGVDGFIIGPYDLSCSMGIPGQFDNPDFVAAVEHIRATGERLNVPAGMHVVEPDKERLKQSLNDNYRFIAYSVDIRMLDVAARTGLMGVRESIKE